MKQTIIFLLKLLSLTLIMFVGLAISAKILGVQSSIEGTNTIVPVVIYCLLNTLILTIFILQSQGSGLKIFGRTFLLFWGIQYFMTQIETMYFNYAVKMPITEIYKVMALGAINSLFFSIFAVLILGKLRRYPDFNYLGNRTTTPIVQMLPNIIILSLIYVLIYFIFGYFVAWQFADLRYFYSGSTDIVNIFQHLSNQFKQDPVLPFFQLFRGFLWSGLSIIIIRSIGIKNLKTYLTSGLLFSILITTPLLFPNPYLPDAVRLGHSYELASSMFLFGIISVAVLGDKLINSFGNTSLGRIPNIKFK